MSDQAHPPGLYQQLLTEGLEQQLRDMQETLADTDGLESQEANACSRGTWRTQPSLPWST
jgi:hypothetical protein